MGTDSGDGASALKTLRLQAGLSQERLAERSGVTSRTIRSLEHGAITNPHASTLVALSAALDLTPEQVDALVRAFDSSRTVRPFSEVLEQDTNATLEQAIQEGRLRSLGDFRIVSITRAVTVGANRRLHSIYSQEVREVRRDGATSYVHGDRGGDTSDARLMHTVDLVGCGISAEVVDPERNVRIVELSFGRPLRQGELVSYGYRTVLGNEVPPADPDLAAAWHRLVPDTTITHKFIRAVPLLSTVVRFLGEPPAEVWALSGENEARRTRDLSLDGYGSVSATWRNVPAGTYGIEWEWPND